MDDQSTILRVKKSIKEVWRHDVPSQRLIFKGVSLHDSATLRECGITDGCILHFLADSPPPNSRSTPTWNITVQDLVGHALSLPIPENSTISRLKKEIQNAWGHPSDTQRLVFRGRLLADEKCLKEEGVANNDTVHLLAGLPGRQPSTSGGSSGSGVSLAR
eukprot:TRINITY_DN33967_c0_g1_i1.p1 TRINITY_DN33967_c0_g1~~TRINITY_DN33967_c0_g1_i1.p1  ORF type:complete len:172 (+),score=20.60 TRINITY_DN33967_c0_g1_i1:35-517(+)